MGRAGSRPRRRALGSAGRLPQGERGGAIQPWRRHGRLQPYRHVLPERRPAGDRPAAPRLSGGPDRALRHARSLRPEQIQASQPVGGLRRHGRQLEPEAQRLRDLQLHDAVERLHPLPGRPDQRRSGGAGREPHHAGRQRGLYPFADAGADRQRHDLRGPAAVRRRICRSAAHPGSANTGLLRDGAAHRARDPASRDQRILPGRPGPPAGPGALCREHHPLDAVVAHDPRGSAGRLSGQRPQRHQRLLGVSEPEPVPAQGKRRAGPLLQDRALCQRRPRLPFRRCPRRVRHRAAGGRTGHCGCDPADGLRHGRGGRPSDQPDREVGGPGRGVPRGLPFGAALRRRSGPGRGLGAQPPAGSRAFSPIPSASVA